MKSVAFFAVAAPLLVFVVVCCLGIFGDRVDRRKFGLRDLFLLMTIVAVASGVVAAAIQFGNPLN
jgi:hypothetical protein